MTDEQREYVKGFREWVEAGDDEEVKRLIRARSDEELWAEFEKQQSITTHQGDIMNTINNTCCSGRYLCASCQRKKLTQQVAAVVERVARLTRATTPTLTSQVEAEVAKHPGVLASVNEATGRVATFVAPVPYWMDNDSSPSSDLGRLRAELSMALAKLNQAEARFAPATEIMRLEETVRSLRVEVDAAQAPRREERQRQRTGGDRGTR